MSSVNLRKYLGVYQSTVEGWKQDHEFAMLAFDVQDSLKWGLFIREQINQLDESARLMGFKGQIPSDEFATLIDDIEGLYSDWLRASKILQGIIDGCIEMGYSIDNADNFRTALDEVTNMLTPDDEFFSGPQLIELRDAAIDAHARGETTEWGA